MSPKLLPLLTLSRALGLTSIEYPGIAFAFLLLDLAVMRLRHPADGA